MEWEQVATETEALGLFPRLGVVQILLRAQYLAPRNLRKKHLKVGKNVVFYYMDIRKVFVLS